ncbi:MAG: macro domain-containing protein [Fimbriimonadales bacterium]|nr:macro domain-containing protein [Fimbriimonadales bacterium]
MEGMRVIRLKRGDLFQSSAEAWVNTVNTQGVMGKGLAYEFKKRFPENHQFYQRACETGQLQVGKVLVFPTGQLHPQYIINFPTKQHWRGKSKLEYIREGLKDLAQAVRQYGIQSIAIPPLGCGQGGLRWEEVKPLIEQTFAALPDVEVHLYEPSTPTLEPVYAGMLHLVDAYSELSPALSEQELKLLAEIWLMQTEDASPPRARKDALTPSKLVDHMVRAPLLEKQFFGGTPVYGLKSADLREEAQRTLQASPEWRAHVERTLALLEGCDSLAALQALVNALKIYQDPVQRRYFPALWKQVREQLNPQSG